MQTATCMVKTNEMTVLKKTGVTPAEALILEKSFRTQAGGQVITEAVETEPLAPKRAKLEIIRLQRAYRNGQIEALWPGASKNLPTTFAEVGIKLVKESSIQIAPSPDEAAAQMEAAAAEEEAEVSKEAAAPAVVDESKFPTTTELNPKEHWKVRQKREREEAEARARAEAAPTSAAEA